MKLIERLLGKRQPSAGSRELGREQESSPTRPGEALVEEDQGPGRVYLVTGAVTDRGHAQERNEDAFFVLNAALSQEDDLLPMGLCIVADGMGGSEGGGEASALAVRLVAKRIVAKIYLPVLSDTEQLADRQPIHQVLREAVAFANGRVHQACSNGGTTLTCAFVLGTNAFIAHVGDSRAYAISGNAIRRLTTDHSLVNRLIELGQITPEEARTHAQRSVLYRALGRAATVEVDTYLQSLPVGSSLLLCSDGLWQVVSEEEILRIVNAASSPQGACRRLVARANEKGGEDNITVVLVQVKV